MSQEPQSEEALAYKMALILVSRSVAKLWKAVQDGQYDSRGLVGDETLDMKEALEGVGIELPTNPDRYQTQ